MGGARTQDANTREIVLPKLPPQALVEARDTIVRIGRALAVGNPVKEMTIIGTFLPHALHLGAAGLEVAKVLLAQARLLVHLHGTSLKRRRVGVVAGQGLEDALGRLARASVRRRVEL